MLFLGIDTATSSASLALARADGVIREDRLAHRGAHARDLLVRLESLFAATDGAMEDLRGIGVTEGPGSFTGVRVGMATAKGLAYALDVPLVGLSTLEALARAAWRAAGALPAGVAAALDAGRGEIYAARFRFAGEDPERFEEDRAWRPADFLAALPEGMPLVGDGARVLEAPAAAIGHPLVILDAGPPLAGVVALRAAALAGSGQRYRPGTLRPNYIRPSDAEAARSPVRKE